MSQTAPLRSHRSAPAAPVLTAKARLPQPKPGTVRERMAEKQAPTKGGPLPIAIGVALVVTVLLYLALAR